MKVHLTLLLPVPQFISLSFPMAALSPPLSLMALAVLLQWSRVALSSFVAFTAVYVEVVPTAPFHLVFSLSLTSYVFPEFHTRRNIK